MNKKSLEKHFPEMREFLNLIRVYNQKNKEPIIFTNQNSHLEGFDVIQNGRYDFKIYPVNETINTPKKLGNNFLKENVPYGSPGNEIFTRYYPQTASTFCSLIYIGKSALDKNQNCFEIYPTPITREDKKSCEKNASKIRFRLDTSDLCQNLENKND